MKKLFKKKKSEKNLSSSILLDEQIKKQSMFAPPSTSSVINMPQSTSELPALVMPKPRRPYTPTRAILGRFDHDKTQVDEDSLHEEISPILLPTAREVTEPPMETSQGHTAQQSVTSDYSSTREYDSAVESLSDPTMDTHSQIELPTLKKQISRRPLVSPPPASTQDSDDDHESIQFDANYESTIPIANPSLASSATVTPRQQSHYYQKQKEYRKQQQQYHMQEQQKLLEQQRIEEQQKLYEQQVLQEQQRLQKQQKLQEQQKLEEQQKLQEQQMREKEEYTRLFLELKHQVELMEQQRIIEREEWARKEQLHLDQQNQMLEKLMMTEEQLNNYLMKQRYQKQLQHQQWQQQMSELNLNEPHALNKSRSEEFDRSRSAEGDFMPRHSRRNSVASNKSRLDTTASPSTTLVPTPSHRSSVASLRKTRPRARSIESAKWQHPRREFEQPQYYPPDRAYYPPSLPPPKPRKSRSTGKESLHYRRSQGYPQPYFLDQEDDDDQEEEYCYYEPAYYPQNYTYSPDYCPPMMPVNRHYGPSRYRYH